MISRRIDAHYKAITFGANLIDKCINCAAIQAITGRTSQICATSNTKSPNRIGLRMATR